MLNEENVMKKRVACPKLLVKCLVALGVVTALAVAVLWLSVGSVLPIGVGIVIAFWLLVGLGVLLYAMNLQNIQDKNVNSVSGGEFQRARIARALAQQTPYIFLDEPLAITK